MKARSLVFATLLFLLNPAYGVLIDKVTIFPLTIPDHLQLPSPDQLNLFEFNSPGKKTVPTFGTLVGNRAFINLVEKESPSSEFMAYFTAYTFDFNDEGIGTFSSVQKDKSVVITGRAFDRDASGLTVLGAEVWGNGIKKTYSYTNAVPATFDCTTPSACKMTGINPGSYYLHNKTASLGSFEQILSQSDDFRFMYYAVVYDNGENPICHRGLDCTLLTSSKGTEEPVRIFNQTISGLQVLTDPYATSMAVAYENYGWDLTLYKVDQLLQKIKGQNIHIDQDLAPLALSNNGKNIYLTYVAEGSQCLTSLPLNGEFLELPRYCETRISGEPDRVYIKRLSLTESEDFGVFFGPAGAHTLDPWKPYYGFFYNVSDNQVIAFSDLIKQSDKPDFFDLGHDLVPEQIHYDADDSNVLWVTLRGMDAAGEFQAAMLRVQLEDDTRE